jgi:hypothetical protein
MEETNMSTPNPTTQGQEDDKGKKNGGEPAHSKGMVCSRRMRHKGDYCQMANPLLRHDFQ